MKNEEIELLATKLKLVLESRYPYQMRGVGIQHTLIDTNNWSLKFIRGEATPINIDYISGSLNTNTQIFYEAFWEPIIRTSGVFIEGFLAGQTNKN